MMELVKHGSIMKLYSALGFSLSLFGLQHHLGMLELEHAPLYNYDDTHYPAYVGQNWSGVSIQKLKNANIFENKVYHGNAHVFELGTQFYRLNDAEKLGAVQSIKNVLASEVEKHETIFLVDSATGHQIGMYSDIYGIILH